MEKVQENNIFFFVPLVIAYLLPCVIWLYINKKFPQWWYTNVAWESRHKCKDLLYVLLAVLGILMLGHFYRMGYLIPELKGFEGIIWMINNVVIYSPLFVILIIQDQSMRSILISSRQIFSKITYGILASIVSLVVFTSLRDQTNLLLDIIGKALLFESLVNFPAVFFEGVAIAFVFIRFVGVLGKQTAIIGPSLLFAIAHIPGGLAAGDSLFDIFTFFLVTCLLTMVLLYTALKSRDIIWLSIVHYFMDVAIRAF